MIDLEKINFKIVYQKSSVLGSVFGCMFYVSAFIVFFLIALNISGLFLKITAFVFLISCLISIIYAQLLKKYIKTGEIEISNNRIILIDEKLVTKEIFNKVDISKVRIEYDGFQGEDASSFKWIDIKSGIDNTIRINCKGKQITYKILIESMEKMIVLNKFLMQNEYKYEIRNLNNSKPLFN
jgi:hypothetical protein